MSVNVTPAAQARIIRSIATELGVNAKQVEAAVGLLDDGDTVPFIARYRKEVTGNLDDTQLRTLEERLIYLRELEDRRAAIIASIALPPSRNTASADCAARAWGATAMPRVPRTELIMRMRPGQKVKEAKFYAAVSRCRFSKSCIAGTCRT